MEKVEAKAKKIAAHLMEADEGDIVIENGALKVAGTDKNVPWFQMALAAYTTGQIMAMQDARRWTPALAMEVVAKNLEEGNAQAITDAHKWMGQA